MTLEETSFMHGAYARLKSLQEAERENATLHADLERLTKIHEQVKQEITEEPTIGRTVELLFREPLEKAEAENRELKRELARLTGERDAQAEKRLEILLDDNCIATIKKLTPEGGEEISFGGIMGGVRLKWNGAISTETAETALSQAQQALRDIDFLVCEQAADYLKQLGGGPMEDRLRLLAEQLRAAEAGAQAQETNDA
jgi:hypothetical protein